MTDQYETLELIREEDGLTILTLNRPDSMNALNDTLVNELHNFLDSLTSDSSTRVVLVRGAGRAFCAGLDLKNPPMSGGRSLSSQLDGQHRISSLFIKIHRAPQPFIACIQGAASGGGMAFALASNIRIAADNMRMNAAFIRIGLSACDVGVSYFLPRLVGASVASELLLTGDFIEAERALATGLVSKVVPESELLEAGRAMAARILRNSPAGVRLTKECLQHTIDAGSLEEAIALEDRNQLLCVNSGDFREGVRAFLEKRSPVWGAE